MIKKTTLRISLFIVIFGLGFSPLNWAGDQTILETQASPAQVDSLFGITIVVIQDELKGLDLITAPDTQTQWVRSVKIHWSDVEPNQGDRNWSALDQAAEHLQLLINDGITPLIVVERVPEWARLSETANYLCSPMTENAMDDFADFIHDVMVDTNSPLKGFDLRYWELFNEPDIAPELLNPKTWWGGCWGDADDEYYGGEYYARMLEEVYPVIKKNDPEAQVLVGGLLLFCNPDYPPAGEDCKSSKFLEGILVNGGSNDGGDFFDGVSFHSFDFYFNRLGAYGNAGWHTAWDTKGVSTSAKASYIGDLLADYGYAEKSLMNTESALLCDDCAGDIDFENTKAYYLAQAYGTAIAEGLRANIWYDLTNTWGRNTGLVVSPNNLTTLPAYDAYQFASQKLGTAEYIQDITAYAGVTGFAFLVGDRIVSLLWSKDGQAHEITLPEVPIGIFEVDGAARTPQIDVTVDLMPLYIETQGSINQNMVNLPIILNNYQHLVNGNFEQGGYGWVIENQGLPAQVIANAEGETVGSYGLLLGNPEYECTGVPIGYSEASQTFTVPKTNQGATIELKFKYVIYTQDSSFDKFSVHINDEEVPEFQDRNNSSGDLSCDTWYRIPGSDNSRDGKVSGWAVGSIDLSAYLGETIKVSFQNQNGIDATYNTYTYLDDVEIVIGD